MYGVHRTGQSLTIKDLTLGEAEKRAKALSQGNAERYFAYSVEQAAGPNAGALVSTWVQGVRCAPDQFPRVELRQHGNLVAKIPVVDGDTVWSLNAADVLRLRMSEGDVVLVNE